MSVLSVHKQLLGLVAWFAGTFIAAAIGSVASINAGSFYLQLVRPDWTPPAYIFGPVWTVLYILMATAAWMIWRIGGFRAATAALTFYILQLVLNALWSWLFFRWHLGAVAFAEVALLWITIVVTMILFWRLKPLAGILLVPYLLWTGFAAVLNFVLWRLNPELLS